MVDLIFGETRLIPPRLWCYFLTSRLWMLVSLHQNADMLHPTNTSLILYGSTHAAKVRMF